MMDQGRGQARSVREVSLGEYARASERMKGEGS